MHILDFFIFLFYTVAMLAVGWYFKSKIKTAKDLFAAGESSPWLVSGFSAYMTMFSSASFVVWGGIAYKYGMVAITILCTFGVAAFLIGVFVAGKWKRTGVSTPVEYIGLRFGKVGLNLYTWVSMVYKLLSLGVALYTLGVLFTIIFKDQSNFVLYTTIIISGLVIILYTVWGGLWAVLFTDLIQFIVLFGAILIVIPFCLNYVGGWDSFTAKAPPDFFEPIGGSYNWYFILAWTVIQFVKIGGEFAFIQRFICVKSESDARKAAFTFSVLSFISPFLWMLPAMIYRVIEPAANPEQAYISICKLVLPPGFLGLIFAAMYSATASTISGELNVFAGILTHDFYKRIKGGIVDEARLVIVGRMFTILLGLIIIFLSLGVRYAGGAETLIISLTGLFVAPLAVPIIWSLFSKNISVSEMVFSVAGSFALLLLLKGFVFWGYISGAYALNIETFAGIVIPVFMLGSLKGYQYLIQR